MRFAESFIAFGYDFFILRERHHPRAIYLQREENGVVIGLGRVRIIVSPRG